MESSVEQRAPAQAAWDAHFQSPHYVFGTEPNAWLARHRADFEALNPGRVLAVADGEGRNGVWLSGLGLSVDAFDISPVAIAKAKALAEERGVSVNHTLASQAQFGWPAAHYDAIVAVFVQYADPAVRADLFAKIRKSLKVGGTLYLLGYTPRQLGYATGGPRNIEHLYTADILAEAFSGLDVLESSEFHEDLSEGVGHRGPSALIGFVARKCVAD